MSRRFPCLPRPGVAFCLLALLAAFQPAPRSAHAAGAISATPVSQSSPDFARPHDLVLSPDKRFLYVADLGHHAIQVVDPVNLQIVGTIAEGEVAAPHDVIFDREGRLLVADTGNDRIAIYRVDGTKGELVAELKGGLGAPEGVAQGPDGRIYVTNAGRATLVVFENGRAVRRVGSWGDGPVQFSRPHDIEVGSDGRVYIADPGNNRIQILDSNLDFLGALAGAPPFDFNEPKYMKLESSGILYVADQYNDRIQVFDPEFAFMGTLATGVRGDGPDQLNRAEGVEVLDDLMWVSDTYNDRIVLYRLKRE